MQGIFDKFIKHMDETNNYTGNNKDNFETRKKNIDDEYNNGYIVYPQSDRIIFHFEKELVTIDMVPNNIVDLINIPSKYPCVDNIEYNINIKIISQIVEPLKELDEMIGMKNLKDNIIDQVLYYVQGFHEMENSANNYLHTVIYGPPGTGKTEIAKIIGKIFSRLGILKNGTFKKVTRADLIAGYLGQTALKTKEVIQSSLGGVLFIDEAYALGNNETSDSFAKECIDTLCEALSDNKDNLMVIIAGYEYELNTCFFNYNPGLDSRFMWRFKTDNYDYKELHDIYVKNVKEFGWTMKGDKKVFLDFFQENYKAFPYFGRDIQAFFIKTKIAHSRRVFGTNSTKTHITNEDLLNGFVLYDIHEQDTEINTLMYV